MTSFEKNVIEKVLNIYREYYENKVITLTQFYERQIALEDIKYFYSKVLDAELEKMFEDFKNDKQVS